jgi:membrane protein
MNADDAKQEVRRLGRTFPVRVIKRYLDAQGPNWATLIAWNALFALFPIVLVTVTVIGFVLNNQGIAQGVEQQVVQAFPGKDTQRQILMALNAFRDRSGQIAALAFAGLLWGGSGLFGAIEQGLCALYGCKPRDFVRSKLMSFAMILLFTVLAVPLVSSGSLLPALESLPAAPHFLRSGVAALLLQFAAGSFDGAVLFLAIFYVVPNRRQRFRRVLPGALAAGLMFEGLTLLFPLYFKLAGGFAAWGATFGLFFLLMTYVFLLGQILMIAGALNAEYDAMRTLAAALAATTDATSSIRASSHPARPSH